MQPAMQKVSPYLWFDTEAEQAAHLYVDVFNGRPGGAEIESRVLEVTRSPAEAPGVEAGQVLVVAFELEGVRFVALNGGPMFTFNESVSFFVRCGSQEEVDYFWNAFTADGGQESQCGWLKDRYGLSWQIIPQRMMDLLGDPDPGRSQRAMQAMLQMQKIDLAEIERAADAG
jgi:predicted 3-demethylubiquinone-9 3-methyltransferase (glyoxalase superfamily)